jgi:hypothetical protein
MPADIGIATRLRAAGLKVRETHGWKARANSSGLAAFNPKGGVNHHTAGHPTKTNPVPSLGICINGRADLPGPLCNVLLGFDGIFYVIAAGPANHAGLPDGGTCRGMTGNSTAYGMEIEHDGTSVMPADMVKLAARGWAAILRGRGIKASQVVQHREWAPSRKIDAATNFQDSGGPKPTAGEFRGMIAHEMKLQEKVNHWHVSSKNRKGERPKPGKEPLTGDPEAWAKQHPGAFQRGKVTFKPKRT